MQITGKDDIMEQHSLPRKTDNQSTQAVVATMKRSDLYQALFPAYYLSKAWGLLPVRFTKLGPKKYSGRLHLFDVTYSMCLLLVLLCFEFWGLWRDLHDGWEHSTRMNSKTTVVVTCSDIMAVVTLAAVAIGGAPFRWNKMKLIIDRLVEVDEKLGITSMKKTRKFCIILLLGSLISCNLLSISDYCVWDMRFKKGTTFNDKGPVNYIPLYFLDVPVILMEIQIALAAYNLGQRIGRLNKSLGNMLEPETLANFFPNDLGARDSSEHGQFRAITRGNLRAEPLSRLRRISDIELIRSGGSNSCEMIYDLVTVHAALSDTVLLINSTFGVPALITVLSCLVHLIITPYFFILEANGAHNGLFLAIQFLWCVGHVGRLLIVVEPCYAASVQAKKTSVLVSQLLSVNWEQDVRKQLEIFSLQLLHRPLEFSACGLCILDRALVTSVAGAVTTYLVILIQFEKEDQTQELSTAVKNVSSILFRNGTIFGNTSLLKLL